MARHAAQNGSHRDATRRVCPVAFKSMARGDRLKRQGGVYLIIFALSLLFIMGLCGFALDISRVYNRKAELQSIADAAALAAARELTVRWPVSRTPKTRQPPWWGS